jgi:hypothetical protein
MTVTSTLLPEHINIKMKTYDVQLLHCTLELKQKQWYWILAVSWLEFQFLQLTTQTHF